MSELNTTRLSGFGQFFGAYGNGGGPVMVEHGTLESDQIFALEAATEQRGVEMPVLEFFYKLFLKIILSRIRDSVDGTGVVDLRGGKFEILFSSVRIAAQLILRKAIAGEIDELEVNKELAPKAIALFEAEESLLRDIFRAAINDAQICFLQEFVRGRLADA